MVFTDIPRHLVGGQHVKTTIHTSTGTKTVPDYAFIQGIFIGCVSAYVIVFALIGPENHGSHFENSKTAFQAGASREDISPPRGHDVQDLDMSSVGSAGGKEKEVIQLVATERPVHDGYV